MLWLIARLACVLPLISARFTILRAGPDWRMRAFARLDPGRDLRVVEHEAGGVAVRGYAGLPDQARADRSDQYVFVNNRPASAPVLYAAIREGYHTLLPSGRHPVLILFVNVAPGDVDVNVHPTKKEVRFGMSAVRDAVIEAIGQPCNACPTACLPRLCGQSASGVDLPLLCRAGLAAHAATTSGGRDCSRGRRLRQFCPAQPTFKGIDFAESGSRRRKARFVRPGPGTALLGRWAGFMWL